MGREGWGEGRGRGGGGEGEGSGRGEKVGGRGVGGRGVGMVGVPFKGESIMCSPPGKYFVATVARMGASSLATVANLLTRLCGNLSYTVCPMPGYPC